MIRPRKCPGIEIFTRGRWRPSGCPRLVGRPVYLVRMSKLENGGIGVEPLWSIGDLAGFLGVSASTIYDWRSRGLGPVGHRLGKHLKYARGDVEAWLASRRDDSDAEAISDTRSMGNGVEESSRPFGRRMEIVGHRTRGEDSGSRNPRPRPVGCLSVDDGCGESAQPFLDVLAVRNLYLQRGDGLTRQNGGADSATPYGSGDSPEPFVRGGAESAPPGQAWGRPTTGSRVDGSADSAGPLLSGDPR